MKSRTLNRIGLLLALPLLFSILFNPLQTATAQEIPPEKYPEKPFIPEHSRHDEDGYIFQTEDGKWHKRETSVGGRDQRAVRDTGGPDDFGYTWERLETGNYEWVDVSSGINTGLDGNIEFTEKMSFASNYVILFGK